MIQRESKLTGELAVCACGRQPRHYEVLGKMLHVLECPPCGRSTGKHAALQQTVEVWERGEIFQILRRGIAA